MRWPVSPRLVWLVIISAVIPHILGRGIPNGSGGNESGGRRRTGRFFGLLRLLTDSDYYFDDDSAEVVKTSKIAYIPIPFFFATPQATAAALYNSHFPALAPPLPPPPHYYPMSAGLSQPVQNQLHDGTGGSQLAEPVGQLQAPSLKIGAAITTTARGRLTRQTSVVQDEQVAAKADKESADAEEVEETKAEVVPISVNNSISHAAPEEEMKEVASEAVNKLPNAVLDSGINNSSSSTTPPTPSAAVPAEAPSPAESLEVGEWEYLGTEAAATTVNNTNSLQFNQTSSYYRRAQQQSFDPDQVFFTTTGQPPDSQAIQQEGAAIHSDAPAAVGYHRPFRPSEEYNEDSRFKPIVGHSQKLQEVYSRYPYW